VEPASKISLSPDIVIEAKFMLQALFLGMVLYFLYEIIIIIRNVFTHGKLSTGLEDFLYWITNTYLIFKLLFKYNYGIIRWFVILGVASGMLLCKLVLRSWFVNFFTKLFKNIVEKVQKAINFIKKHIKINKTLEKNKL